MLKCIGMVGTCLCVFLLHIFAKAEDGRMLLVILIASNTFDQDKGL